MTTGPNVQRRPADTISCAVNVAQLATGGVDEIAIRKSGRVRSGIAGAKARAEKLTPERRSEIAAKAAAKRWV